jgi:hypothetical protein
MVRSGNAVSYGCHVPHSRRFRPRGREFTGGAAPFRLEALPI